jgi:inosose dehydratase
VRHGVFCELGRGDVDFGSIKHALEQLGYQGWVVVEQDVLPNMGSPLESAIANRNCLRQIGL